MTPGDSPLVCHLQCRWLHKGTGACAPIVTNSWERGHQTPYQGFARGPNLRLSDNLTPHQNRGAVTQTVGPEPQGTGARVPPLLQIAGHVRRTTWDKQKTHHPKCIARHENARQND